MDSYAGRAKEDDTVAMLGCRWKVSISGQRNRSSCEGQLSERFRKHPPKHCFGSKWQ